MNLLLPYIQKKKEQNCTFLWVILDNVSNKFFSQEFISSLDVNDRGSGSNILINQEVFYE